MGLLDHFFGKSSHDSYTGAPTTKPKPPVLTEEPKYPITRFTLNRIKQRTGGIDTKRAYALKYAKSTYSATIFTHQTKIKREDSPDLHIKEVSYDLDYNSENMECIEYISRPDLIINLRTRTYIDKEYQYSGLEYGNYRGKGFIIGTNHLDHPMHCDFLNEHWEEFLAAIDSIADQIKHDCDESFVKEKNEEKSCCKKKLLSKIKEAEEC